MGSHKLYLLLCSAEERHFQVWNNLRVSMYPKYANKYNVQKKKKNFSVKSNISQQILPKSNDLS